MTVEYIFPLKLARDWLRDFLDKDFEGLLNLGELLNIFFSNFTIICIFGKRFVNNNFLFLRIICSNVRTFCFAVLVLLFSSYFSQFFGLAVLTCNFNLYANEGCIQNFNAMFSHKQVTAQQAKLCLPTVF